MNEGLDKVSPMLAGYVDRVGSSLIPSTNTRHSVKVCSLVLR